MGVFSGANEASGTQGGYYYKPGNYLSKIDKVTSKTSRKGVPMFIVDTEVIESDCEEIKVGSRPSYVVMMDKDPALGNVADFCRAALACKKAQEEGELVDIPSVELSEELIENDICGAENILVGTYIEIYAYNKPTKAGNDFTHLRWSIPKELVAELKGKTAAAK